MPETPTDPAPPTPFSPGQSLARQTQHERQIKQGAAKSLDTIARTLHALEVALQERLGNTKALPDNMLRMSEPEWMRYDHLCAEQRRVLEECDAQLQHTRQLYRAERQRLFRTLGASVPAHKAVGHER